MELAVVDESSRQTKTFLYPPLFIVNMMLQNVDLSESLQNGADVFAAFAR